MILFVEHVNVPCNFSQQKKFPLTHCWSASRLQMSSSREEATPNGEVFFRLPFYSKPICFLQKWENVLKM
jgi:hypothetical protein